VGVDVFPDSPESLARQIALLTAVCYFVGGRSAETIWKRLTRA
jgi:hypothetical protein